MTSHQLPVSSHQQTVILSRRRRIYLNSHPDLSGFLNSTLKTHNSKLYPIFCLLPVAFCLIVFLQNEPNFGFSKMTLSHFLNETFAFLLLPFALKNEPKRTQIEQKPKRKRRDGTHSTRKLYILSSCHSRSTLLFYK